MVFSSYRLVIIFICIGCLAVQPHRVSAVRGIDFVLSKSTMARVLRDFVTEELNTMKNLAPAPLPFDPNQSSKRRVRRGSDPIHNRC
ncbi:hypothetical protein QJS10_CPA06g00513 [Acorus calamus]|uniref:Uncharacterized protein n=1 Tax=Acorus calamus TaxID=4465 RepID=A0AAV9EJ26_ACOCL|nr:hypothetical protein QJS10_CPA06g00513 [Acorus calamus]